MARSENVEFKNYEAGADLSTHQFKFVQVAADGQIDPVGTAGGDAVGVLYNLPSAAGQAAQVGVRGTVKVKAGAAVAVGAKVSSDNAGRAITAVATHHVLGRALTVANNANELIEVDLVVHPILA